MHPLPLHALALLLALSPAVGDSRPERDLPVERAGRARAERTTGRPGGARQEQARPRRAQEGDSRPPRAAAKGRGRAAAQRAPSPPSPPSPALRALREEQQRRLLAAQGFERVKGLAYPELERRRIDAALGGTEREIVAFLLGEEAIHRDRVARLARLRELALETENPARLRAVETLERAEQERYVELLQRGCRRLSSTTQRDLQVRLAAGRAPVGKKNKKQGQRGNRSARDSRPRQEGSSDPPRARRAGR